MEAKSVYEEQILKDMQELAEHSQRKPAKVIRFFKDPVKNTQLKHSFSDADCWGLK